jgi:hypothetical protein
VTEALKQSRVFTDSQEDYYTSLFTAFVKGFKESKYAQGYLEDFMDKLHRSEEC